MTRLTLKCIGLAAALSLLLGSTALAATFSGEGTDDPKVRVTFEKKRDRITGFRFRNALFHCDNNTQFRADMEAGEMHLNRRDRFEDRFTDAEGKVVFRVGGKINGRRARGTLRVVAYVDSTKCDTRTVGWKASATSR